MEILNEIGKKARVASIILMTTGTIQKNRALRAIEEKIKEHGNEILAVNKRDVDNARANNIEEVMIDRLALNDQKLDGIIKGLRQVEELPDPVGEVINMVERPNGLRIGKKRVPIGVIGMIYESRPNVTVDAAGLCLKSGNAVILRGGSDAINTNIAFANAIREALATVGLPKDCVQIIEDTDRKTVNELMKLNEYIDVLIPRGGASLIQSVVKNATVPVIETGTGNCHVYVAEDADPVMAREIAINAKTSRPSVCNSAESLLIDKAIANEILPDILNALEDKGVTIRGCEKTKAIWHKAEPAIEEDWGKEYLDYMMSVKVVDNIDEAIAHINKYSTKHSETIITKGYDNAMKFHDRVDSAVVYVNASTRFTDGEEFGFGAEIGISTQKLHVRGPIGLKELTSTKYIIFGDGQIR